MTSGPSPVTQNTAQTAPRECAGALERPGDGARLSASPRGLRCAAECQSCGPQVAALGHRDVGLALSSEQGAGILRVSLNSCFVTTHK